MVGRGGDGGTRTRDLWDMSPASYRLLYIAMTPPTMKWWGVELFSCAHQAAQRDDRLRLMGPCLDSVLPAYFADGAVT